MKKKILLTTLLASAVITCLLFVSDGLTYLITSLMALAILGGLRVYKGRVMKISRWAKANPGKAQWLISSLQLVLLFLGIIAGKNLDELGYHLSNTTAYVFSAIMIIGFLTIPFLPMRKTIALPNVVDRHRLAYMGILLSSLVMTAVIGNRIGDIYPNSFVSHAIDRIDQSIFSDQVINFLGFNEESTESLNRMHSSEASLSGLAVFAVFTIDPGRGIKKGPQSVMPGNRTSPPILNNIPGLKKEFREAKKEFREVKKDIRKKFREGGTAGITIAATFIVLLLIAVVCAGICLAIGAWGVTGLAAVVSGILVTAGAIFAIVKVVQWARKKKTEVS